MVREQPAKLVPVGSTPTSTSKKFYNEGLFNMEHIGYFVRFNNFAVNPEGTGKLHINVLKQYSKVIWGQWRNGVNLLNNKTMKEMNTMTPFSFYALDKNIALLKMRVIRVLTREEVIAEKLEYLIPNYYNIDTPCSAYYLIDKIEVFPPESAMKVININTNRPIYLASQVNSTTPWRVREISPDLGTEDLVENKVNIQSNNNFKPPIVKVSTSINSKVKDQNYTVYCYTNKTLNKSYIGMTNDIKRRRSEHENPTTWQREKKKYLYINMQMFGLDDFEFKILHENLTEEEAHYWEAKEIENYNSYFPNGFNERNESRYLK